MDRQSKGWVFEYPSSPLIVECLYVTIIHYLVVAIVESDYFETCGLFLLRHNVDCVLRTCFSFVAPSGSI